MSRPVLVVAGTFSERLTLMRRRRRRRLWASWLSGAAWVVGVLVLGLLAVSAMVTVK